MERVYLRFNYPKAERGSKTLLTGIRGKQCGGHCDTVETILYICGFYVSLTGSVSSFVYNGDISTKDMSSNWYDLNIPSEPGRSVISTSLYGPDILKHGNIRIVGNYITEESNGSALGCMYEGLPDGSGKWVTLIPIGLYSPVINTIAHSTHGNIVVGNYDTKLIQGRAFIYDICSNTYYDICPSGVEFKSITAYGVWHNCGSSYTICGGFSQIKDGKTLDLGYIVDWNSDNGVFNNWHSYKYNKNALVSHFDGIASDNCAGFNLTGNAILDNGKKIAFYANIDCDNKISWEDISYPDSSGTSGNSIYKSIIVGVYQVDPIPTVNGYVSVLI